jgi:O-antigen/teichoic acid export membrane protein
MFSLNLLNAFIGAFLKTTKSFKYINRIGLINSVFNIVTYSLLFYLDLQGIITVDVKLIFATSILVLFLNTLLWVFSFSKNNILTPIFKLSFKEDVFPFFKYIFPVFIGLVLNFLNYRFDIWIVSYYQGNIQLGLYVLAVNFAQFILLYSRIIGGVMMPYLSEDNEQQRKIYFTTYSRINFVSIILMVLTLGGIGDWLLVFLYGEEFANSSMSFNLLLIGMIFTAMSQLFSIMLFSKGKNNVVLVATIFGLISTVVLDLLLIPRYGIEGAAIATSLSYFTIFSVLLYYLLIKEKIKLNELFLLRKTDFNQLFQKD